MRIALVHSFYRSENSSGENIAVDRHAQVLQAAGHEVLVVARYSDDSAGRARDRARLAWQVATGTGSDPSKELQSFVPDIVHVHNLFPNFGTRWLRNWSGPLVATIHNYRPLCANALLLRDSKLCTLCPDGDRWAGVKHSCYRDSKIATLPLAIRNHSDPNQDQLLQRADRIIMLSPQAAQIYQKYGISAERMRLLPHGLDSNPTRSPQSGADRWLSVGRLSEEKGWRWLVENWPRDVDLDVVGTGPMLAELQELAPPSVRFLGSVDNEELRHLLPRYRGSIFAGITPEGAYPLTAVEALAAGVPLLAREGGAAAKMVERWGCGSIFRDGYEMSERLHQPTTPADRQTASHTFRDNFTTEAWLSGLLAIYRELVTS
jgi:glycosyltransferase involved in cell wall biosynthesis